MQFPMPVLLTGSMSFQPEHGNRINQIYVLNCDESSTMTKGYVPAKMSCDQSIIDTLPSDSKLYPMELVLMVSNKTSGGKTVQHAVSIQTPQKKAS